MSFGIWSIHQAAGRTGVSSRDWWSTTRQVKRGIGVPCVLVPSLFSLVLWLKMARDVAQYGWKTQE